MWKFLVRGVRESFGRCGERAVGTACEGNGFANNARPGKEGPKNQDAGSNNNSDSQFDAVAAENALCSQSLLKGLGLSTVVWFTKFARDWHYLKAQRANNFYLPELDRPEKQGGCRYKCLLQILAGIAKAQPKGPQDAGKDASLESLESSILSSVVADEQISSVNNKELMEATNGLGEISSNIENVLGVYYYDHYQPERALKNFKRAWSRGNVKACYNLGLCYELGVGTEPNPGKAVEYYQKASNLGHVQAVYNLGVYYAQGRGGLPRDPIRARQLFNEAANKGLIQAKAAINELSCPAETRLESHPATSLQPVTVGT
ncbi:uncharacterized protein LOC132193800 [Neocloeon triangulifer]|uniref:uncharacterized protein LOC132193800 n=1 Tax=Neocloeon triangulifer TaxID=2078957 RepID=UPI00286F72C7|nr:uncharacterized protein LOC132193800 [Neocloeon triangulifer]